jgi:transcription elongation factor GreB
MIGRPNYITPAGIEALRARYRLLFDIERPKVVETVSWAAGNGDRSENGDYIYGKKRLREIDWELGQLSKKIKTAKVINPADQTELTRIWFGAIVRVGIEDDVEMIVTLIGDDEQDVSAGKIGWSSPVARALRGGKVGEWRRVELPSGEADYEIIAISYPVN